MLEKSEIWDKIMHSEVAILFKFHRVVIVDALDGGQGVVGYTMIAEELTAMRKTFLHKETHTDDLCAGLTA